jgi:starch phosphorylase
MLGTIAQSRLLEVAEDEGFIAQMQRAAGQLEDYLKERTWFSKHRPKEKQQECYAYFSAEFGLSDCLPIYSGGLGVLAGDHLKSASDLGLPLVGVGLLYQEGYFSQYLNPDGWQQEHYPINDFYNMPLHLERDANGEELRIAVDYPGRQVYARVWRVQVGTVALYMLDTNIEPNNPYDHDITDQLYGGDQDMRIHQELMLGIGGTKMLKALGLKPKAYHMNEGHSAFLSLERIRGLIQEEGLSYLEAKEAVSASNLFTTHTPVPAGFDLFPSAKVLYYLGYYQKIFGISQEQFLALGRENTGDLDAPFSMATLAIKTASFYNGVSKLHGEVSRDLFKDQWPEVPVNEVPITSVTNGVHARSCVGKYNQELFDRYLGPKWASTPADRPMWEKVYSIPDEELWRTHERCRTELVVFVRERLQKYLRDRGASLTEIEQAKNVLDPSVLTIGFARRFATYKRGNLFLRDLDRIKRILFDLSEDPLQGGTVSQKKRMVQFVIAGKAHPKDIPGKEMIRDIIHTVREQGLADRVVFIPNYDIYVSRLMVAGCDVWLNNPRRPREASGTSGMKAAMNGIMNLSILDGWWDEADYVRTGWPIGSGEMYEDQNYQDQIEANALYDLIEQEVVPLFYERDQEGIPHRWVGKMKDAIRLNCPTFNTSRMVGEYAQKAYFTVSDRYDTMTANNYAAAKELAHWKQKLYDSWYDIKIVDIDISESPDIQVNQNIAVKARIHLAGLSPSDVQIQLYKGAVDADGEIVNGETVVMDYQGSDPHSHSLYTANIHYSASGFQGLSLRVLPKHQYLSNSYEPGYILWANN